MAPIDLDKITNDPTHEHYAYRPRKKTIDLMEYSPLLVFLLGVLVGIAIS